MYFIFAEITLTFSLKLSKLLKSNPFPSGKVIETTNDEKDSFVRCYRFSKNKNLQTKHSIL